MASKYDVFLSFRGEDTRKTFVDHLYSALKHHLIHVYKDDEALPRGESINQSLFDAIQESKIAVIIFSKNYADSSWCLEELAHIMKCKNESNELVVMPVFYNVEPRHVRNQIGEFGEAFAKQEANNVTRADIWRRALVDASNIAGWEPKNIADGHESQFIKKVVDTILDKLFVLNSCVDEDLVGIRVRFQKLESLLDVGSRDVRMVGIWGVGGSGKTTLATSLCMEISRQFQAHCIVENVREETNKQGLSKLQESMLSALFKRKVEINSVVEGKHMMKRMLSNRKVLVLLDDVDKLDQLEALVGKHNWFGSGSRILITTRDKHLLKTHKVNHIYPVTLLSNDEAIQLFKTHAYNEENPVEDYETLSSRVVSYASGLPLSLKVLGSFLYDKNKNQWIGALKKLADIPNPEVMNILKISYNGLEPYEKELFLDIACFWRGKRLSKAMEALEACGFHPEIGIKVLSQKALITTTLNFEDMHGVKFNMHDLVQEMGHYIVRGELPPAKHSRVWKHEDIKEICSGDEIPENDTIEAIRFTNECDYSLPIGKLVSKMKKLRWLDISTDFSEGPNYLSNELRYIYWYDYPASFFPDTFLPKKLVVLRLEYGMQRELWMGDQDLPHLKVLQLSHMRKLIRTPNFNGLPRLQELRLYYCNNLVEIHPSLENCTSFEYLYIYGSKRLQKLPTFSHMKNIKCLLIRACWLKETNKPCGIGLLSNLQELDLSSNYLSQLDFSLSQLTQLKCLVLSRYALRELPKLPSSLAILKAPSCGALTIVEDFNKDCKELCQVTLKCGWSNKLLQSMLKGNSFENGSMHLRLEDLEISKGFTPPLLRGSSCRLKLPENWCNDFSGFLMCMVASLDLENEDGTMISMKQVSGVDFEDDAVWEERDGDSGKYQTWVWYVSFGPLRRTIWWDQTFKALDFNIQDTYRERPTEFGVEDDKIQRPIAFGVRLVEKKSNSDLTSTSTSTISSSHYAPKFKVQDDSADALTLNLMPFKPTYDILNTI